jgi:hypothetical protein
MGGSAKGGGADAIQVNTYEDIKQFLCEQKKLAGNTMSKVKEQEQST